MTTGNIILGVRLSLNDFKRIDIENYNLEESVDRFKDDVTNKIGVDKNAIALIYCGVILEGNKSLSSCGVKPGEMIHVLKKPQPPPAMTSKKMSQVEFEQLVVAFKAFMQSPGYRNALQRLSRPEVLETIKAATPGLGEDPVAIAIIQDPELIVQLANINTVKAIAEKHPTVLDAANYITAHMHEEAASANSFRAGTSTGYSYSLEALSDEDEMESNDTPREAPQGGPLTRNTSYSAITAAQLADAILNSTQNMNFGNLALPNANPANANNSRTLITSEMFNTAIQNALNPTNQPAGAPQGGPPATPTTLPSSESLLVRLQPQLQQMQEMGLTNDAVNLRALQITSGDVQAAVELVFSGAVD